MLATNNADVVVVTDKSNPGEDLQLLASLKHLVYSHGTYGLWGILLSDAETVVYPEKAHNASKIYGLHKELAMLSANLTDCVFITVPRT